MTELEELKPPDESDMAAALLHSKKVQKTLNSMNQKLQADNKSLSAELHALKVKDQADCVECPQHQFKNANLIKEMLELKKQLNRMHFISCYVTMHPDAGGTEFQGRCSLQ